MHLELTENAILLINFFLKKIVYKKIKCSVFTNFNYIHAFVVFIKKVHTKIHFTSL